LMGVPASLHRTYLWLQCRHGKRWRNSGWPDNRCRCQWFEGSHGLGVYYWWQVEDGAGDARVSRMSARRRPPPEIVEVRAQGYDEGTSRIMSG